MSRNECLPVLLVDFDGTVTVGDGPVLAYLDAVLASADLPPHSNKNSDTRTAMATYLQTGWTPEQPWFDGYHAVAELTADLVDANTRNGAYRASRQALEEGKVEVNAAAGIAELLADLGGRCRRVLATNSPRPGISPTLARLDLTDLFDEVRCDAGKPAGMHRLLNDLIPSTPHGDPAELLSLGDVWINDLAIPFARGCAVAYIDRHSVPADMSQARPVDAPPVITGPNLAAVAPAVRRWAFDAAPDNSVPGRDTSSPRSTEQQHPTSRSHP